MKRGCLIRSEGARGVGIPGFSSCGAYLRRRVSGSPSPGLARYSPRIVCGLPGLPQRIGAFSSDAAKKKRPREGPGQGQTAG